ncbi:GNAT family N-acetyltransferase [Nocardioides caldifontis]|uniref:GNAT family N-acetyltransferase n=1 Tax=Nocardioides caldifontis TaxID=2588938 RepID=UPI0011DF1AED|nr:GNAT family N-acetyltransferase [Nocardioides caldifontis]
MDIRPLDPDDAAAVAAAAGVISAAEAADAPWQWPVTPERLRGVLLHGFDLETPTPFLGYDGEQPVAFGALHLSEWDNLDVAWWEVQVHPAHRGTGVGTAMLRHLEKTGVEAGRTSFGSEAWEGNPGVAFALRHGYEQRSSEILRRQHLAELDLDEIDRLHREAAEAGRDYELLRVSAVPEDLLEQFAELAASINDAPLDDLDLEDEVYVPQRVRNYEEACRRREMTLYRVVARHRGTGELAGHTAVVVDRLAPTIGYQHDTSVARKHRGHRLGLLLKAEQVRWLLDVEPQLRTVDTWNAESNDHMIAVNEALGYRWTARELAFQK